MATLRRHVAGRMGSRHFKIVCGDRMIGEGGVMRDGNEWQAVFDLGTKGSIDAERGFRTRDAALRWLRVRARKIPCSR